MVIYHSRNRKESPTKQTQGNSAPGELYTHTKVSIESSLGPREHAVGVMVDVSNELQSSP